MFNLLIVGFVFSCFEVIIFIEAKTRSIVFEEVIRIEFGLFLKLYPAVIAGSGGEFFKRLIVLPQILGLVLRNAARVLCK